MGKPTIKRTVSARQSQLNGSVAAAPVSDAKPTLEEIGESPLLFDEERYWRWACRTYGKPFMTWVRDNWITASEREIQVMHRAWIAAGGATK